VCFKTRRKISKCKIDIVPTCWDESENN